jgi:hypothetical protein
MLEKPRLAPVHAALLGVMLALIPPALVSAQDAPALAQQLQSAGLGVGEAKRFFKALKQAVASGDKAALAAMSDFPITVAVGSGTLTLSDREAFEQHYRAFMTPALAQRVAETRFDELFANYQGVMLGNGAIWFAPVCKQAGEVRPLDACDEPPIRLIRINGLP